MKKKNDIELIILSVLLAIVMWAFVVTSTNPSVNRTFRNIPILVQNKDELEKKGYTITGLEELTNVTLRVEGSRDKIVNLKENDIQASIDVENIREGIQTVGIKVETPSGVSISMIDPQDININVQKIIEKKLPVNLVIKDSLKDGKTVEVNEQSLKEITVKGPVSAVNKIDRVEVNINDPAYLDGKIHNLDIHVLDKDNKEVSNIERSNSDINISFKVTETKRFKVNLKTYGDIAEDYEIKSYTISPEDVVLKGNGQVLDAIDEIDTYPVNIDNLKADKIGEIRLKLPEGVDLYDGQNPINYKIIVDKKEK